MKERKYWNKRILHEDDFGVEYTNN